MNPALNRLKLVVGTVAHDWLRFLRTMRTAKGKLASICLELLLLVLFVFGNYLKVRQFQNGFQIPLWEARRLTVLLLLFVYCLFGFLGGQARRWMCLIGSFCISSLICIDSIHYRFYGDVSTVNELFYVGALNGFVASLKPLLSISDLAFFADFPLWLLFLRRDRQPQFFLVRFKFKIGVVLASLVAFFAYSQQTWVSYTNDEFHVRSPHFLVAHYGLVNYHLLDLSNAIRDRAGTRRAKPAEVESTAVAWFKRKPAVTANWIPFGAYSNYNVILLQVESLQAFAVDATDASGPVMPFLSRLKKESISFENFFSQAHFATTSDAEYCALNSLLPWEKGTLVFRFFKNDFDSLPWTLNSNRYSTCVFQPTEGHVWNGRIVDAAYGFQRGFYTDNDRIPGCTNRITGWMDADFLPAVADKLTKVKSPFFAFVLTISSHLPFELAAAASGYEYRQPCPPLVKRYMEALHYTDHALHLMWQRLQDSGLLARTMVIIYGDHPALPAYEAKFVFQREPRNLDALIGSRVPLIIHLPGFSGPKSTTVPAGQVDLAPTITHLLGIPSENRCWLGRNLLANYQTPLSVAFANGNAVFERAAQVGEEFIGVDLTHTNRSDDQRELVARGRQATGLSQDILELNLARKLGLLLGNQGSPPKKAPGTQEMAQ